MSLFSDREAKQLAFLFFFPDGINRYRSVTFIPINIGLLPDMPSEQ